MGRVVIVGGGVAGVWQAACLADRGAVEIDIVDPSPELGRGLAYATANPNHLLNVTPDKLDPNRVPGYEAFVSWLSTHHPEFISGYCPRHVFGAYMSDVVSSLRSRVLLRHHRAIATEIAADAHGLTVTLDNGAQLAADHVILALGNLPPRRLACGIRHPRIMEDPWRLDPTLLSGARSVILAGAGLTAADVAISINEIAPQASITLAANRPFMPPADATVVNWTGAQSIPSTRPSRAWRHVIGEIRSGRETDHWIAVIEAAKSVAPQIWNAWSARDKATFVRHGLRHWLHHRHRMPLPSFELIQRLIGSGQLQIARGRVGNIQIVDEVVRVTIGGRPAQADLLINATGPSVDPDDEPLLKVAAGRGLISRDGYGLGLAASQSGQAVGPDGEPTPGLWILGAWTRGTHFEVVAVPLVRKHAAVIADAIAPPRV